MNSHLRYFSFVKHGDLVDGFVTGVLLYDYTHSRLIAPIKQGSGLEELVFRLGIIELIMEGEGDVVDEGLGGGTGMLSGESVSVNGGGGSFKGFHAVGAQGGDDTSENVAAAGGGEVRCGLSLDGDASVG